MSELVHKLDSPIGPLYIRVSDTALRGLHFSPPDGECVEIGAEHPVISLVIKQLDEYFRGERRVFDVPLDFDGTDFQKRVWNELLKIPFGKTISYGSLARRLENEKAVRAVGTANGRNPIAIIVPCHRVIQSNGSLGGYNGGLELKTRLLQIENSSV